MRSIIAAIAAFSFVSTGTVQAVQAQETPEYFLTGSRFKERAHSAKLDASAPYSNWLPNCTAFGRPIYPCG